MGTHLITQADNEKTIEMRTGDSLTIQLPENPTTGYRWSLDQHDPSTLAQVSEPSFAASGTAVGSGGGKTFKFAAKAAGDSQVRLNLRRSWESEKPGQKSFHVKIHVRD